MQLLKTRCRFMLLGEKWVVNIAEKRITSEAFNIFHGFACVQTELTAFSHMR